ncbi:PdaC/SigV domain-containing protein [Saccharibacillus sacchari]|uniref:PdaC/SigV domain-containing protein n=1 Tax=Saccharibacillus sacchari TaxID=456493 RepID=UPI0004B55F25|nr:DUF4163 domain-containing protein [Saccharibacillus sacchari]
MNNEMMKSRNLQKVSAVLLSLSLASVGTIAMMPLTSSAYAAEAVVISNNVSSVKIDGKTVKALAGSNGMPLVSLRAAAAAAGAKMTYDAKTRVVTLSQGTNKAIYALDSDSVVVKLNGSSIGERYEAKIIKGVSYIAVDALAVPFGYEVSTNMASGSVTLSSEGQNDLSIAAGKLSSTLANGSTKVNIVYPVVSGLEKNESEQAINAALKGQAQQFLKTAEAAIAKSNGPAKGDTYEFYTDYQVTFNKDGVVSFLLGNYTYLGGANGTSGQTGMTFSLKDGKTITLGDLLQSNKQADSTVKGLIESQVKRDAAAKGYTLENFKSWTQGTTSYLDHFYLNSSGVTILVPLGSSAPSALNVLEFSFSWQQLLKNNSNPLDAYRM